MHIANNFWMSENVRQEPVLSLPNSDNYNFAARTDNFLPLPNGGGPNHLNSYLSPQNSVASSHQIGRQVKMTNSQCVWPSSLTFRSSYANNFQTPETYSCQNTSLNHSTQNSQVQQNYYSKYLNTNFNFAQVFSNTNTNNTITNTYTNNTVTNTYMNNTVTNTYTNNISNNVSNINGYNNNNNGNCNNSVQAQNNNGNMTPISRIRVRDVFSLNNSALHNSLLENNLPQTHQKEQTECILNHALMNNSASFGLKMPAEYVDYEKVNLVHSNCINPPYGCTTVTQAKPSNHQKSFQPSELCYKKNVEPSDAKKMEKRVPPETFGNDSLIEELSNPEKNCEVGIPNVQQKSCDALFKSKRVKVQPKRTSNEPSNLQNLERADTYISAGKTNNSHYTDSSSTSERITQETSGINKNVHNQNLYQKKLLEFNKGISFSQTSPSEEYKQCRKSEQCIPLNQKYSNNQIETQQNNLVKITIPHTGQSSFISIDYSNDTETDSTLNLPFLSESQNQLPNHPSNRNSADHNNSKTDNNGGVSLSSGQINQGNSVSTEVTSPNTNPVCNNLGLSQNRDIKTEKIGRCFSLNGTAPPEQLKTSNEGLRSEEHLVGLNKPENHVSQSSSGISETISESVNSEIEKKGRPTESVSHGLTASKVVVIKRENLELNAENPSEPVVPENQMPTRIIKTENNVEDIEMRVSKNGGLQNAPLVDDIENSDFSRANVDNANANKPVPESKVTSDVLGNVEDGIPELNSSEGNSSKAKVNKTKSKESKLRKKKVHQPKIKFRSKINKKKLDLLIKFLNNDEETVEMNNSERTDSSDFLEKTSFTNKEEKKVESNRSRRKLNKTGGKKSKNNCRKAISKISDKDSGTEILKCSSENPQSAQTSKNSNESEERVEGNSSVIDGNVSFQESQTGEENRPKPDSEKIKVSACKQNRDTSEKCLSEKANNGQERNEINSALKTFRGLKTHFCMSCKLTSSVESFWVNVASGELRCLNCFKKILIRTKERILKPESEEVVDSGNSEANLLQKSETNQSRKENKDKKGFESGCDGSKIALRFGCGHGKSNDSKENIQKEVKEAVKIWSTDDITIKNYEDKAINKCCTVNAIDISDTSRRKSAEDKPSILWKIEEQKELTMKELLQRYVDKLKIEEIEILKSKILNAEKQVITEICEKSKKFDDIANEIQNSGAKASPTENNQINASKEKCSAPKIPSNHSSKEEKILPKEKGVSLKARLLKNYNEENCSKSEFGVSCDIQKTQTLTEGVKSNRKATFKEETVSKELIKTEKSSADVPNQNGKKTGGNEEVACRKLQISEEHSKKEMRIVDSLNEPVAKTCHKESFACQKSRSSEGIPRRDSKHESLDKLKAQNSLKESDFDRKSKSSEKVKNKETDITEKSKKKCVLPQNLMERHKKAEWIDHSRKRLSLDEGYAVHKVHLVEEHAKRMKPMTPSYDRSNEENAEREKQNEKNSLEKSRRNSWSKEGSTSFEDSVRKETSQTSDFWEKLKAKGDLYHQKANASNRSDTSPEVRRRKSKVECSCLKPVDTKEPRENKIKKSLYDSRRNSARKEDSDSLSKRLRMETAEYKENKTVEEKERRQFQGKIPKKPSRWDVKVSDALRSPLSYGSEEMSNVKAKHEQFARIRGDCQDKKYDWESFQRNSNQGNEKTENLGNKEGKEMFQRPSDTKTGKETENDINERKDQRSQMQGSARPNLKAKTFECFPVKRTEDSIARKSRPNFGCGSEKTMLSTELTNKTKKLP